MCRTMAQLVPGPLLRTSALRVLPDGSSWFLLLLLLPNCCVNCHGYRIKPWCSFTISPYCARFVPPDSLQCPFHGHAIPCNCPPFRDLLLLAGRAVTSLKG